jgi:hypothetical protein
LAIVYIEFSVSSSLLIKHLEELVVTLLLVVAAAGRAAVLVEEVEDTLLGLVALARQVLERLLALHHLLAAYNAAVLVLNEVRLGEATGGVLRVAVENRSLGANRGNFGHLILWTMNLFDDGAGPKT